eukprot:TRINITY_DN40585_c0_g1_i1.p1 TRINITY_DN40585_c0_g1~~TRINITY_DN40585_c0_g1_i1.p1  ORF type:complete len:538 (+),score=181.25 TRINITY_DN40585_c0_g1_i1:136-1749(+)
MLRWTLALLALIVCTVSPALAVVKFNAARMVQYDDSEGTEFGSRGTSLNIVGVGAQQGADGAVDRSVVYKGQAVILPSTLLHSEEDIESLINTQGAAALIIVLPKDTDTAISDDTIALWSRLESFLLASAWNVPIYFARAGDDINQIVDSLTRSGASGDRYQLSTTTGEAVRMKSFDITNIQGWLHGYEQGKQRSDLPTIAIVANYDQLGVAPGASHAADSNGSGVSALLELARLFAILYDNQRTQPKVNLLFLLSGGGRVNHVGARQFLQTVDPRELDGIDFALCLDSIAHGKGLKLHVSKVPKDGAAASIHAAFKAQAKATDFPFEVVHKKINISNPLVSWEHEQFSRKRVVGGTLSHYATPLPFQHRPTLFDTLARVNSENLANNVKFIAESLARHMYGFEDIEVFSGQGAVSARLLSYNLRTLVQQNRAAPYTGSKIKGAGEGIDRLKKTLEQYTVDTTASTQSDDSGYVFYGENTYSVSISAYKVKSMLFDGVLALALCAYCLVLHVVLRGPSEGFASIKNFFVGAGSKKRR